MPKVIYIASMLAFSGKSALCTGLMRRLIQQNYDVGYMKPVSSAARLVGNHVRDEDAGFVLSTFKLKDPLEAMAPVILTDQKVSEILGGTKEDLPGKLKSAFEIIASKKDVVILEGGGGLGEGRVIDLAPPQISALVGAKALVIVTYCNDLQVADDLFAARALWGNSLLGGVINMVPNHRLAFVKNKVRLFLEGQGIPIFAVLPKERILLSASVAEISERVNGYVLCGQRAMEELVEHLVVGAMTADTALTYFRRTPNKAVITGGDRPDIILAALETSTRCVILTGNIRPSPQIIGRAEDQGIPLILTRHDTMTAIDCIEIFFGRTRFHQDKKQQQFDSLLDQHMDFERLFQAMGME